MDPACLKLDFRSDTDIFAGSNSLVAWYLGTDTVLSALALDARTFLVPFLLVLRACEFSRMGASLVVMTIGSPGILSLSLVLETAKEIWYIIQLYVPICLW